MGLLTARGQLADAAEVVAAGTRRVRNASGLCGTLWHVFGKSPPTVLSRRALTRLDQPVLWSRRGDLNSRSQRRERYKAGPGRTGVNRKCCSGRGPILFGLVRTGARAGWTRDDGGRELGAASVVPEWGL